ncbi:hypothetical protein DMY87_23400 [Rhizobium wuzhouense]|uniref:Anti-sigma factor NepR domain-containing protein n=3 Tax=Rhizobium TaxID=379 RepID=A0ABX5NK67_9HYPH|nr:hypothetical protein DMY87_23400 [Rhizobium wuzhouense]
MVADRALPADNRSNPLDHMTENSKKVTVSDGLPGMAAFHPGVSAQLREFYQSVQEEGIPQRFLELLERLDVAERRAEESIQNREAAR